MANYLDGKVAIVTGAGRGIGAGVAKALASEGAKVMVCDIGATLDGEGKSSTPADQVVDEIKSSGGEASPNFMDISTMEGGESVVQTTLDTYGKLDIVVTVAGILRDRMIFNMTEQEWDDVIKVHLKGTFAVCKYASILYRQQRSGRIITFASESGLIGNTGQANYAAEKSGIAGFTKVAAKDLGRYGVTANVICPRANTRMTQSVPDTSRELRENRPQDREAVPIDTETHADDIGPFVAYLATDQASFINGQTFLVYGGTITKLSLPRRTRTIFKQGRWSLDELRDLAPRHLTQNLINPSPPPQTHSNQR